MRIVVKVGTSTLAYATGRLNIRHTEQLVKVLSDLKNEGHGHHHQAGLRRCWPV